VCIYPLTPRKMDQMAWALPAVGGKRSLPDVVRNARLRRLAGHHHSAVEGMPPDGIERSEQRKWRRRYRISFYQKMKRKMERLDGTSSPPPEGFGEYVKWAAQRWPSAPSAETSLHRKMQSGGC
jgi:hypothetical protein